ncbi:hypothetical protein MUK42_34906 [Musa troglodytarum]|uniref:Uncharacterized protein n=1 Tax=Musa troglodytarum TaxID=320322 RepID=A0A9E7FTI4_9LILI|nr:hypothetical protein MUK42_34906 [Musa troglodytarum]
MEGFGVGLRSSRMMGGHGALLGEGSSVVSPSSLLSVSPASSDEPKIFVDIGELCDQLSPSLGGDTMNSW